MAWTTMIPAPLVLGWAVEGVLLKVLVQLIIIIAAARVVAGVFRWVGQPRVVGEIAAGLMLGPSLLGWLFPGFWNAVFRTYEGPAPGWAAWVGVKDEFFRMDVSPVFEVLSQLGLVFLLFLIGLEFDFSHLRRNRSAAGLISIAGIAVPFALGVGLGRWMHGAFEAVAPNRLGFCLFMGTAMSITAIPVLGRIMMELNLTRTRIGVITITAAAIGDAVGWILLAGVTALVKAGFSGWNLTRMSGLTVAFAVVLLVVLRPALGRWAHRVSPTPQSSIGPDALARVIILIFICSIVTSLIGIFAIFGAFVLGAAMSGDEGFRQAFTRNVWPFINAFFLPIFFAYTGLRTDIGSLDGGALWLMAGLVCLGAVAGKFVGCGLAARVGGLSWRDSVGVGAMMNTRGLMELIVANVGHDLGVIPKEVYCMLVMMAMLTTLMTSPLLLWLMNRDPELRPLLGSSRMGAGVRAVRAR